MKNSLKALKVLMERFSFLSSSSVQAEDIGIAEGTVQTYKWLKDFGALKDLVFSLIISSVFCSFLYLAINS